MFALMKKDSVGFLIPQLPLSILLIRFHSQTLLTHTGMKVVLLYLCGLGAMKDYSVPRYARTRLVTIHKDLIYMICDLREMCCVHADWVFCWVRINHYHAGENAWNDGLYNLHEFNDVWRIRDVKFPRRSRIPQFFPLF